MKVLLACAGLMLAATQATAQDAALPPDVAAGKALYEVDLPGGYGCIPCHGADAKGGRDGPGILGQSSENMQTQLATNDSMSFIELSEAELEQISAYLVYLVGK